MTYLILSGFVRLLETALQSLEIHRQKLRFFLAKLFFHDMFRRLAADDPGGGDGRAQQDDIRRLGAAALGRELLGGNGNHRDILTPLGASSRIWPATAD